jgi:hypothetical protein
VILKNDRSPDQHAIHPASAEYETNSGQFFTRLVTTSAGPSGEMLLLDVSTDPDQEGQKAREMRVVELV